MASCRATQKPSVGVWQGLRSRWAEHRRREHELLEQMGAPPLSRRQTAREVVEAIVKFQGVPVWDFQAPHGRADREFFPSNAKLRGFERW